MRRIFVVMIPLLVLLAGVSCGGGNPETPEDPWPEKEYPTTLSPLPQATLDSLQAILSAQNPGICATLNEYGFPERSMVFPRRGLSEDACLETLVARAKAAVVANALFTGVADVSALQLNSYVFWESGGRRWAITCRFGPQAYAELEVKGSHIWITIDSVGAVDMDGTYFPAIHIPDEPVVFSSRAQELILGLEIKYWVPGALRTYVVEEGSLVGDPDQLILVHELPDAIELRVAWRIPVWSNPVIGPSWYVYVDTMDGEVLEVQQLFRA